MTELAERSTAADAYCDEPSSAPLGLRLLLFALPTTAAFGGLLPGMGPLFLGRVLCIVLLGLALALPRRLSRGRVSILPVAFIWLMFFAVGFVGNPNLYLAIKMTVPVAIGLGTIAALERLGPTPLVINSLLGGWVAAFVVTGLIGVREALTQQHLSNYFSGGNLARIDTRLVASVFGNPNAFATFLVMVLPFLAAMGLRSARAATKLFSIALVGLDLVLVLVTGSRLGALSAVLVLGVILLLIGAWRALALVAFGSAMAVFAVVVAGERLLLLLPDKIGLFMGLLFGQGSVAADASYGLRTDIYRDGVWLLTKSHGLGLGPGAFEWNLTNSALPFPTGGIHSPHNAFLEIAVEAGLLTLLALLAWVWRAGYLARRSLRNPDPGERSLGIVTLSGIAGAIPMALANSSWVTSTTNWCWLATIGAIAAHMAVRGRRGSTR